jgi:hypothetical protein
MGDTGLEHPPLTPSKPSILKGADAKSDARDAPKSVDDPALMEVIVAWPRLSDEVRERIRAIIAEAVTR